MAQGTVIFMQAIWTHGRVYLNCIFGVPFFSIKQNKKDKFKTIQSSMTRKSILVFSYPKNFFQVVLKTTMLESLKIRNIWFYFFYH